MFRRPEYAAKVAAMYPERTNDIWSYVPDTPEVAERKIRSMYEQFPRKTESWSFDHLVTVWLGTQKQAYQIITYLQTQFQFMISNPDHPMSQYLHQHILETKSYWKGDLLGFQKNQHELDKLSAWEELHYRARNFPLGSLFWTESVQPGAAETERHLYGSGHLLGDQLSSPTQYLFSLAALHIEQQLAEPN